MSQLIYNRTSLVFVFEFNHGDGKYSTKRVTLAGVRSDLTPDELAQITMGIGDLLQPRVKDVQHVVYQDLFIN